MTAQQGIAGDLAWFLVILTVLVWVGIWIAKLVRTTRIEDAYPQQPPDTCQLQRCRRPATHKYDAHPSGQILYICTRHAAGVGEWIGHDTERPFDQDLAPGTDLHAWEEEL